MKIMYMRILSMLFCLSIAVTSAAQEYFTRAGNDVLPRIYSGSVMASTDLNKDGLDDLVVMDRGNHLKVFYQRADGRGFYERDLGQQSLKSKWSMVIGDLSGNGSSDILMMGAYDDIQWVNVSGDRTVKRNIIASELYAQGANLTDINRDGNPDLFVCNDIAESYIYEYEPSGGRLKRNSEWLDMTTAVPSDNSGNYGSVWMDLDKNGLPDLYIAKCKAGVMDPADPRRINTLYLQKDSLVFEEVATDLGLADGSQSWTADFADVDNDGDWDCFIANHKGPSKLLIQNANGKFEDRSSQFELSVRFNIIQAKFADINNDGWVDLILSGAKKALYINNGGSSFEELPFLDENAMTSFVTGDWNNDGRLDLYASYCDLINIPSSVADRLWWNQVNAGNFVRFKLEGTESNRDAIGARVELFAGGAVQMREVRAGESYGIQNSNILHFGTGSASILDSVILFWPSGGKEIFRDLEVNQTYHILESKCINTFEPLQSSGKDYLCGNDSIALQAPEASDYLWSNGDTTKSIYVKDPGQYWVNYSDGDCRLKSQPIFIRDQPDALPIIESSNGQTICEGSKLTLSTIEALGYQWSNGGDQQTISIESPGSYWVSISGFCRDTVSDVYIITESPVPAAPEISGDSIVLPGFGATVKSSGEKVLWYEDLKGGFPVGTGPWFSFPELYRDTTVYAAAVKDQEAAVYSGGEAIHKGGSRLSANSLNGGIYFTVGKRCILESVKVFTDDPGERLFELRSPSGKLLASKRQNLRAGENWINIQFELIPHLRPYLLTTDEDVNIQQFGHASPLLYRSDEDVQFPYMIGEDIILTRSVYGTRYYYYFYDWKVRSIASCESERVPASVKVITPINYQEKSKNNLKLFPNPSSGRFLIEMQESIYGEEARVEITSITGTLLRSIPVTRANASIEIETDLPPGTYIIRFADQHFSRQTILLIQ